MADNKGQTLNEYLAEQLKAIDNEKPLNAYYTYKDIPGVISVYKSICDTTCKAVQETRVSAEEKNELTQILDETANKITAIITPLEASIKELESSFLRNYEQQYKAGDLSFLVDGPEGITGTPPELLPAITRELEAYKKEKALAELPLRSLLFETDPDSGRIILDLIIERAGGEPLIASKAKQEQGAGELSIQHLQFIIPQKYTMPNSKLANSVNDSINAGEDAGIRISGNKKREIITPGQITLVNTEGVKIEGNYTSFDDQVQCAIDTLFMYGNKDHIITPALVLRTINHNKTGRFSPQAVGAVRKSIEKQRVMHASFDISDVTKQYELAAGKVQRAADLKAELGDMLLDLRDVTVESGGKKERAYYIKEMPFLLEYSIRIGNQIITVPATLLDIQPVNDSKTELLGGSLSNNEERIAIRGYLLRRVAVIKHDVEQAKDALRQYKKRQAAAKKKGDPLPDKKLSDFRKENKDNRILYDSIFTAAGVASKNKQTQAEYKKYIRLCLDNWTIRGYIAGYKVIKGDRKNSEIAADILLE